MTGALADPVSEIGDLLNQLESPIPEFRSQICRVLCAAPELL